MQKRVGTYVFVAAALLAVCSAVSLEDIMDTQTHDFQDTDEDAMMEGDAAAVLEEFEKETFEEIVDAEQSRLRLTTSPKKCCKIGKKVAQKGLYCNIDMMLVQKKNNGVFKRKMKWHGPAQSGKLQYKDLLLRAEKCYPSKASRSMFVKCCEWQQEIQTELENCKMLKNGDERKACRLHVKSRE